MVSVTRHWSAVDYDVFVGILRLSVQLHGVRAPEYPRIPLTPYKDSKLAYKRRMKTLAVALSVVSVFLCCAAATKSGEPAHIHAQILCCCASQVR